MNEKTEQLLRELADKFGTTAEHLWSVLVKQAMISAVTDILLLLITGSLIVASTWFLRKRIKKDEGSSIWRNFDWEVFWALAEAGAICVWLAFLLCNAGSIAAGLFNPEYWALKQLIP